MIPAIFSWSGGKDSSYALYKVMQEGIYDVRYLLSTFNGHYKRLSMHGVREELIDKQAEHIGIPLLKVCVHDSSNEEYEHQMEKILLQAKAAMIETVLFGDIFLQDLREYREKKLATIDMQCIFPLWKINTNWLVNDFIDKGFKSITCCVDDGYLDESFCGRQIDHTFLEELPGNVDPCGENGEYHSFCYEGPVFKQSLNIMTGEKTYRQLELSTDANTGGQPQSQTKGFWYLDLLISH